MKAVIPKTPNQIKYLNALNGLKPVVVATGPAGSGKTLFPCQVAAEKLVSKEINRIIITRPNVTAGEDLGHLPGDINSKMGPWSRPMYDVLENYFSTYRLNQLITDHIIEVCPLAFMRGRTFENSYVIADEMQNATKLQTQMVMTRLGNNSHMVLSGDVLQCDLQDVSQCGLQFLMERLEEYTEQLKYIEKIVLDDSDIQRHPAMEEIMNVLY